jgi:septal ring factor EnvC (AmiA/AmiB activator)
MENEAESSHSEVVQLEAHHATKVDLELKKLALEIADLERPWWKRPAYILAALPTLLAVVALSVGFLNGFFSAQLTKLENQKHDLEVQIRDFEGKRDDLHRQHEQTKQELNQTKEQLGRTQEALHIANHRIESLAGTLAIDPAVLRRALTQEE